MKFDETLKKLNKTNVIKYWICFLQDDEIPQGNGTVSTDEELEPPGDSGKTDDITVDSDVTITSGIIDISDLWTTSIFVILYWSATYKSLYVGKK